MKIKVCGLKNKESLLVADSLGIDYAGFIFYPQSIRCMIDTLLPNDVKIINAKKTGVFVNQSKHEIEVAITQFSLDAIQLHGEESPAFCKFFDGKNVEVIKAFPVDDDFNFFSLHAYRNCCNYFLFDTKGKNKGGNGISFNWDVLKKYDMQVPFFLSGGIGPNNIQQALGLNHENLYCIDVNSKVESLPGVKNADLIKQVISIAKK